MDQIWAAVVTMSPDQLRNLAPDAADAEIQLGSREMRDFMSPRMLAAIAPGGQGWWGTISAPS